MAEPKHPQRPGVSVPRSVGSAVSLLIQVVVAAILFMIIAAGAVALNLVTNLCETHHLAPAFVIWGMRGLEVLLWAIDVVCTVSLLLTEAYDFCKSVWSGRGADQ